MQTGQVNLEKAPGEDIPGGTVDKNPPLNARVMGLTPGQEDSHAEEQLSPYAATTEPTCCDY